MPLNMSKRTTFTVNGSMKLSDLRELVKATEDLAGTVTVGVTHYAGDYRDQRDNGSTTIVVNG